MRGVAAIGNIALDTIAGGRPRVGGAPTTPRGRCGSSAAARGSSRGRPSPIVARSSRRWPRSASSGRGSRRRRTTTFEIRYHGEEREMSIGDPGSPWTLEDAQAVGRAEWVQVGGLTRADFPPDVLAALARDRRLALDGQALVRPRGGRAARARRRLRSGRAPARDGAEAERGGGRGARRRGAGRSRSASPSCCSRTGSTGALLISRGVRERIPVRRIDTDDPTGAGDAFLAGYAWARAAGHRPVSAARHAATTAARVLELTAAPAA